METQTAPTATFIEAVKAGDAGKIDELLHAHPSLVTARTEHDVSAVLLACYMQQAAVLDVLLAQNPTLSLHEAAALGQTERVRALLDEDPAQLNAFAPDGFAPLGLAAFFGRLETLNHLLERGADVNTPSQNAIRVRPLHSAVAHRQPEVALQMATQLLAHGADIQVAQQGGWTPLHQAAAHNHTAMVDLLLRHGADRNARSDDGKTPADMARAQGHPALADQLEAS